MQKLTWHAAILAVVLGMGCAGETGSVGTSVRLALTDQAGKSVEDANGTAMTLEGAEAYVRHIEIDLPSGTSCADYAGFAFEEPVRCTEDSIRIDGPFHFDLVTGVSTPSLVGVTLPAGTYNRIDVRFEPASPAGDLVTAGDDLDGSSMIARGTLATVDGGLPFTLRLAFNEDARFETPNGVEVGEDASALWLRLDPSLWFAELPIARCHEDGDLTVVDGTVRIEDRDGNCSDIENALKEAIKRSGQLDRE